MSKDNKKNVIQFKRATPPVLIPVLREGAKVDDLKKEILIEKKKDTDESNQIQQTSSQVNSLYIDSAEKDNLQKDCLYIDNLQKEILMNKRSEPDKTREEKQINPQIDSLQIDINSNFAVRNAV